MAKFSGKTNRGRKVKLISASAMSKKMAAKTTAIVKKVLKREVETKYKHDYSGAIFPAIGIYDTPPNMGNNGHNATIQAVGDIHRLLPPITQGDDAQTRSGNKINVKRLVTTVNFSIAQNNLSVPTAQNIMVVVYIWQHKLFKDYNALGANNSFAQFLDRGNGTTGEFRGSAFDAALPVASDSYILKKKLMFPLRTPGVVTGTPSVNDIGNTLSSPFMKRVTLNLTNYVPKGLQYPVQNVSNGQIDDYPTNCSLAMSMGYYNMDLTAPDTNPNLNVNYVTRLEYLDP